MCPIWFWGTMACLVCRLVGNELGYCLGQLLPYLVFSSSPLSWLYMRGVHGARLCEGE